MPRNWNTVNIFYMRTFDRAVIARYELKYMDRQGIKGTSGHSNSLKPGILFLIEFKAF